jgi:hypothetical protein
MSSDKKRINSKHKGSEYELKIAKVLSDWWGEPFRRTPMSGGLHWREDNRVSGDIVTPPDSVFPYNIECKKREEWSFDQLIKGTGEIESYWEQCDRDARGIRRKPLLIFSKNFNPDYIMLYIDDYTPILELKHHKMVVNYFLVGIIGKPLRIIMRLDDFIRLVSKEDIVSAYNL